MPNNLPLCMSSCKAFDAQELTALALLREVPKSKGAYSAETNNYGVIHDFVFGRLGRRDAKE
jgi:hypothetical protein